MKHFAVMDDPISLSQLLDATQLTDVLVGVARLHPVAISILDSNGLVLSEVGGTRDVPEHRKMLEYNGDIVGRILVSEIPAATPNSAAPDLAAIADHLATVLEMLVHSAYARQLTTQVHEAAMVESFSEIGDRNERLASAIERLEELERLKSNFLATISHELRTPLTSIIGYSEMMAEGLAGELSEEQTAYSRIILVKAEQLLQLITDILDVSLIEARSLRLEIEPIWMERLVRSVVQTMKGVERQRIVLEFPSGDIPRALGDPGKLRQVLLQLLANAIKFSPTGGEIKISVAVGALFPHDNSSPHSPIWRDSLTERFGVRVTVEDEGIGVAADQRASIFDAFYQADSSSTRAFGGAGLGLSLAKSFVVAHGGFLWLDAQSEVSKKGSCFTFSLPAVPEELAAYVEG